MILEQEFEKLLAAYFEEELDESGLVKLRESIEQVPAHRRRFQRELRLHTLMRESALVLKEKSGDSSMAGVRRVGFGWRRIAGIAAAVVLGAFLSQLAWNHWGEGESVGHCVHVSDSDELVLWRDGKELPMSRNTRLQAGDRISTGNQGQASLRLEGVGTVSLKVQTEIEIFAPNETAAVIINRGLVLVEADKREPGTPPVIFRTPKAEVEVMGTVFGLEVNSTATRVKVHEGLVRYADRASEDAVEVEAGQYCVNGEGKLEAMDQAGLMPGALMPGELRLLPVADACSDAGRYLNDAYLKVEKPRRSTYLKFEVPESGEILGARLRMTQSVDPGEGELTVWEGSHDDWTEDALSKEVAPKPGRKIATREGWVGLDQVIEVDVSSLVKEAGTYTLVVTLEKAGNKDIWFGSKESPTPPELIISRKAR
ncbi:MAG: CBM96 family carbohydrate-binding protein [Verrucomicrobiaceae bacterium]